MELKWIVKCVSFFRGQSPRRLLIRGSKMLAEIFHEKRNKLRSSPCRRKIETYWPITAITVYTFSIYCQLPIWIKEFDQFFFIRRTQKNKSCISWGQDHSLYLTLGPANGHFTKNKVQCSKLLVPYSDPPVPFLRKYLKISNGVLFRPFLNFTRKRYRGLL